MEFSLWIKQHNAVLYKHALWLSGNNALAADIVQETYVEAWKSMRNLRDKDKVLAWLLTILRRIVFRVQREQYRHKETLDYLQSIELSEYPSCEISLIDFYIIFESISAIQRETLLLYVLHGFTYDEIATHLEVPIGTVMSRISRARKAIEKHLGYDNEKISSLDNILK